MLEKADLDNLLRFGFALTGYEKSAYTLLLHFFKKTDPLLVTHENKRELVYQAINTQFTAMYKDGITGLPARYIADQPLESSILINKLYKLAVDPETFEAYWAKLENFEAALLMLWALETMDELHIAAALALSNDEIKQIINKLILAHEGQSGDNWVSLQSAVTEKLTDITLPEEKFERIKPLADEVLRPLKSSVAPRDEDLDSETQAAPAQKVFSAKPTKASKAAEATPLAAETSAKTAPANTETQNAKAKVTNLSGSRQRQVKQANVKAKTPNTAAATKQNVAAKVAQPMKKPQVAKKAVGRKNGAVTREVALAMVAEEAKKYKQQTPSPAGHSKPVDRKSYRRSEFFSVLFGGLIIGSIIIINKLNLL